MDQHHQLHLAQVQSHHLLLASVLEELVEPMDLLMAVEQAVRQLQLVVVVLVEPMDQPMVVEQAVQLEVVREQRRMDLVILVELPVHRRDRWRVVELGQVLGLLVHQTDHWKVVEQVLVLPGRLQVGVQPQGEEVP